MSFMKRNLLGLLLATVSVFMATGSVFAVVPTITPGSMPTVCAGTYSTLSYSSSGSPTTYSITWTGSPVGLPDVPAGTVLPLTAIPVNVLSSCATGTYSGTITVSNVSGSSAPMPISLSVNGLPTPFSVTGGGGYCSGGIGVHVGLSNTEGGVLYRLYRASAPVGTAIWGTGGSIDFGYQTLAGLYTVVGTNASTLCVNTMTGSAIVNVYSLPTVVNVTGGGGYCAGGTGVAVGLAGSSFGVNYQLYRGGTPVGSPLPGVGTSLDFGPQTIAGTYTAKATDTLSPFCPVSMSGSATVLTYPNPTVYNVTGGGDYCDGGYGVHVGLDNSNTSISYKLYRGATLISTTTGTGAPIDFGLQTGAGNYTVTARNTVYSCTANMNDTAVIGLIPVVVPSVAINASLGTTICDGQADSFTAFTTYGGSAPTYVWHLNGAYAGTGNTYTYTPVHNDYLTVTMTSNELCAIPSILTDGVTMTVKGDIIPTVVVNAYPGTSIINGTTETVTAVIINGGVAPTYQWYVNNVLVAGATSSSLVSNSFHDYDTVMCKVYGCAATPGQASVVLRVIPRTGVNDITADNGLQIAPNPSRGTFTVKGIVSGNDAAIKITDIVGKVIYTANVPVTGGMVNTVVQLPANVPAGIYMLSMHTQAENIVSKITVE